MRKILKTLKEHYLRYEDVYACFFMLLFCCLIAYWLFPFCRWSYCTYFNMISEVDISFSKDLLLAIGGTILWLIAIFLQGIMGLIVISGIVLIYRILSVFIKAKKGEKVAAVLDVISEGLSDKKD